MENKKSFILYKDSLSILDKLTDEQAGKLFKAIKSYQLGEDYELDFALDLALDRFVCQFKRDDKVWLKTCERNKINGSKGGRPKNPSKPKKPTRLNGNPKNPSQPDNDNDNDIDTVIDNDNVIDNEKERKHLFKNSPFYDLEKFKSKILEDEKYSHYNLDYYHESLKLYSEQGNKYVNWISTAKNWMRKEKEVSKKEIESDECLEYFNQKIQSIDGSKENHSAACSDLIIKIKKDYPDANAVDSVKVLIDGALKDDFHSKNLTSFSYLLKHLNKIKNGIQQNKNYEYDQLRAELSR